jgi:hypothetical protein
VHVYVRFTKLVLSLRVTTCNISYNGGKKIYCIIYFIYKPNSSKADYINNHILNVFKYIFNIQLINIKLQSDFLNE